MEVAFTTVSSRKDVSQILELQASNLTGAIDPDVARVEGFLTVQHDPDVLWRMNQQTPSVIALNENRVIGYALIMPRSFADEVPILKPMFDVLETLSWRGIPLRDSENWFVMGQVCVEKAFRGQGVFDGLYVKMKEICTGHYDFTVTEVAERNKRSMRAHERVGFKPLMEYKERLTGESWRMIVLDF